MSPARASTSRSRRIVISETPRRRVSSLTRALPAPCTSWRISACRCLASISSPFAGERCGRPPCLRPPLGEPHRGQRGGERGGPPSGYPQIATNLLSPDTGDLQQSRRSHVRICGGLFVDGQACL